MKKKFLFIPLMLASLISCNGKNSSNIDLNSILDSVNSLQPSTTEPSLSDSSVTKPSVSEPSTSEQGSQVELNSPLSDGSQTSPSSSTTPSLDSALSTQQSTSTKPPVSSDDSSSSSVIVDPNKLGYFEGLDTITISQGTYFNPLKDVKAYDNNNVDITSKIFVKGNVNYGEIGNYDLIYGFEINGQIAQQTRRVIVSDTPKVTNRVNKLYSNSTINENLGSYRTGNGEDLSDLPPAPNFVDDNLLNKPIKTSSWWTALVKNNYGGDANHYFLNPLRSSFSNDGVEITHFGEGFTQYWTDAENSLNCAQLTLVDKDITFKTNTLDNSYITKVIDFSDNSVKVAMRNSDDGDDEMVVTFTQGSPYIFGQTKSNNAYFNLRIAGATQAYKFFDLNGNLISTSNYSGDAIVVMIPQVHVGYNCEIPTTPSSTNVKEAIYKDKYYLISTSSSSTFDFAQKNHSSVDFKDRINLKMMNGNYFSVCALENLNEAKYYHQHAYALINRSYVDYEVNHELSVVTSKYYESYQDLNSSGAKPNLAIMPHQYKYMTTTFDNYVYRTIRGQLKLLTANYFETTQSFMGMLPTSTIPTNLEFNATQANLFLDSLDNGTNSTYGDSDVTRKGPYWDAKTFYPLSQGVIYADQLGNENMKIKLLNKLETYLADWLTYSGNNDDKYLYYDQVYGTMYYNNNDFSTRSELSDHHFTHGYLVYAFAVASMYDQTFYNNYQVVANELLHDYMNYDRNSDKYPYLRTFDPWAGHSWAHGFGDFAEGNNQESSGEALNSWVAGYLLGLANNDVKQVDTAIYGFVTELNAIKQYVFDYDEQIFSSDYLKATNICSIIWGGKNTDATWFGLNPNFVYGIHYLPLGEYVTSYAIGTKDLGALNRIYQKYLTKKVGFKDTWFANMWSILALLNPDEALEVFDQNKILNDDYPNDLIGAYWNINTAKALGNRNDSIIITGDPLVGGDTYENHAQLWNPTSIARIVEIKSINGTLIKRVEVPANSFIKVSLN